MIDYETFCKIKDLHARAGLKILQIARALGLHPRTVATWLETPDYQRGKSAPRPSLLDPYKGHIVRWLEAHPYSAAQLLHRLREAGFSGGYTTVKDYVRTVRRPRQPAFLTLSFAPGECAQVDWGEYGAIQVGSTRRRLSFFVMVLCYSRLMYVEFTLGETMEQFLSCHRHAFEFFEGVTEKVVPDYVPRNIIRVMFPTALCGRGGAATPKNRG